jgi:hypothetical protein
MKKLAIIIILIGVGINIYSQSDTVIFSASGGFYENSFDLTLSCNNPNNKIYYTTNGNTPTAQSYLYTQPLHLDENLYSQSNIYTIEISPEYEAFFPDSVKKTIVIRAAVIDDEGNLISQTVTNSYFISSLGFNNHNLPVVSICADSLSLFKYETGIFVPGRFYNHSDSSWTGNYYKKGREWERNCNVEYYMHNNPSSLNQAAGIRTHGGNSRRFPQKGLSLYARDEYGQKKFKCKVFETSDINKFKRLVLKPIKCSWTDAGVQDYVCCKIAKSLNVESPDTRPCTVYINGEYWGIYFIQEKIDERFLENHFEQEADDFNMMGNWATLVEAGNPENFYQLMDWVNNTNFSDTENYNQICSRIDMESFIDYQIYELFIANYDWPANNMKCWQYLDGPWRWIFYDGDAALNAIDLNSFMYATYTGDETWPADEVSTLMFRKLLTNKTFCANFLDRLHELQRTTFKYINTKPYLEQIATEINGEIQNQIDRFNYPYSYESWENAIYAVDSFLNYRPYKIINDLDNILHIAQNHITTNFSFFPNPTTDFLNIIVSCNQCGLVRIDIFDLQGRTVYSDIVFYDEDENIFTIDIQNLPQGTYIVKVGKKTQKVLKIQ